MTLDCASCKNVHTACPGAKLCISSVCSKWVTDTQSCSCCRDAAASTTANTTLTADNVVDTYAGTDGTLNVTSASAAALAILACKVNQPCWHYKPEVRAAISVVAYVYIKLACMRQHYLSIQSLAYMQFAC